MGGGVSIYEGVVHIARPHGLEAAGWGYAVLAASFVFESVSLVVSWRSFRRARQGFGVWEGIRRAKDPTTFVVVLEDGAALIGLTIAAVGLAGTHALGIPSRTARPRC